MNREEKITTAVVVAIVAGAILSFFYMIGAGIPRTEEETQSAGEIVGITLILVISIPVLTGMFLQHRKADGLSMFVLLIGVVATIFAAILMAFNFGIVSQA